MTGFILSLLSILISISSFTGQASSLGGEEHAIRETTKQAPAPFLAPAELPFMKYCEKQQIKNVNWKTARQVFLVNAHRDYDMFRDAVYSCLHINYEDLEPLGLKALYDQYKELYEALKPSSPPQKPVIQAKSNIVRGASSASTASVTDAEGNNHDSDTSTPRADASTLRQRHTSANAVVAVK